MSEPTLPYWFPVATLLLGFFTKALFDWLDHRRTMAREREARKDARRAALGERRANFQRQTLLDLQDALARVQRCAASLHMEDRRVFHEKGQWQKHLYSEGLSEADRAAQVQSSMLMVRVRDEAVRALVEKVKSAAVSSSFTQGLEQSNDLLDQMGQLGEAANRRIGEVLRQLDDEDDQRA